jgi:hypothetical protein
MAKGRKSVSKRNPIAGTLRLFGNKVVPVQRSKLREAAARREAWEYRA